MSQTLLIELPDEVYAAIERQATVAQTSPAQIVATSLEQHFGRPSRRVQNVLIQAGLATADTQPLTNARPLTHQQRTVLAQEVAHGRPLSEYIREERDER